MPWLAAALDVTQRYWDRATLTGVEVAKQLWDWDRFRRRALTHLDAVDLVLSPVAPTWRPTTARSARPTSSSRCRRASPADPPSRCPRASTGAGSRSRSR